MPDALTFDTPDLANAIEALSADEIDNLPFGVVLLDRDGTVKIHNKVRTREAGRGGMPTVGLSFFTEVAPCMDNGHFKGRLEKARAAGKFDISFEFIGDFANRDSELSIRAQPSSDGGTWIFMQSA